MSAIHASERDVKLLERVIHPEKYSGQAYDRAESAGSSGSLNLGDGSCCMVCCIPSPSSGGGIPSSGGGGGCGGCGGCGGGGGGGGGDGDACAIVVLVLALIALTVAALIAIGTAIGFSANSAVEGDDARRQREAVADRKITLCAQSVVCTTPQDDQPPSYVNSETAEFNKQLTGQLFTWADRILKVRIAERTWASVSQALMAVGVALAATALAYSLVMYLGYGATTLPSWTWGIGIAGASTCVAGPLSYLIKYIVIGAIEEREVAPGITLKDAQLRIEHFVDDQKDLREVHKARFG